jgi:aspartokinase
LTQLDSHFPIEGNSSYLRANVHFDQSRELASRYTLQQGVTVVSGYAARDPHGDVALLGRNASDYVAALIAGLYGGELCFAKDVPGIYSGFGTPQQRLLASPTRAELDALGEQKVLDRRAYHTFRGPIRVMRFGDAEVGTIVPAEPVQGQYLHVA